MSGQNTKTAPQPATAPDIGDAKHNHRPARWQSKFLPPFLAAAFVLIVLLATRSAWFGNAVAGYDEQLYSFIGWRMTHGELPFVDWWDRKPFGLFAIFAIAHFIFGPEALAYQILAAIFAAVGAWLTYLLARDRADRPTSAIAAAMVTMLIAYYGNYSGQSEVFFLPMVLAMVWLVRDPEHPAHLRRSLWAMLIGGLALQIKYTVLPQCIFLGLYALWPMWRQGIGLPRLAGVIAAFAALGLLPTILVGLFYASLGEFDAFFFANFLSFFDRAPSENGRFVIEQLYFLGPLFLVAGCGIIAVLRLDGSANRTRYLFIAGWFIAALASVFLPSTVYPYYYAALVPPVVLFSLPALDRKGPLGLVPGLLLLAASAFILNLPERYPYSQGEAARLETLAAAIAPHVGSQDNCLFVFDGPTALYRLTNSCAPSRLVYPDHLNNALEANALEVPQEVEVARILALQPGVIVTAQQPITAQNLVAKALVEHAIAADYIEDTTVSIGRRGITVWIRYQP